LGARSRDPLANPPCPGLLLAPDLLSGSIRHNKQERLGVARKAVSDFLQALFKLGLTASPSWPGSSRPSTSFSRLERKVVNASVKRPGVMAVTNTYRFIHDGYSRFVGWQRAR
jgi:hypothetical protein